MTRIQFELIFAPFLIVNVYTYTPRVIVHCLPLHIILCEWVRVAGCLGARVCWCGFVSVFVNICPIVCLKRSTNKCGHHLNNFKVTQVATMLLAMRLQRGIFCFVYNDAHR